MKCVGLNKNDLQPNINYICAGVYNDNGLIGNIRFYEEYFKSDSIILLIRIFEYILVNDRDVVLNTEPSPWIAEILVIYMI